MPRPKGGSIATATVDKPRGRMTAYAFFVQICRQEHKRKYPDQQVVFQEFSKKCAERWKPMSDKEKLRFNRMAEDDKKRYDVEKADYDQKSAMVGVAKPARRKKKKKDPNAPKRSMSAFFWFSQDERKKVRAANPNFGVGDVAKELGRRWGDAEASFRSKYEALAEKDRARYGKAKKAYQLLLKNPVKAPEASTNGKAKAEEDAEEEEEEAAEESE